jgi:hypothetical protein
MGVRREREALSVTDIGLGPSGDFGTINSILGFRHTRFAIGARTVEGRPARLGSATRRGTRTTFGAPVGPNVGAAPAAGRADKALLDVGEPRLVRPRVRADRDPMAATVVGAPDHDASNAHLSQLAEGDLIRATTDRGGVMARVARHAPLKRGSLRAANCRLIGASGGCELPPIVGVDKRHRLPQNDRVDSQAREASVSIHCG